MVRKRVAILTPATFTLIAVTVAIGLKLDLDFDKVLKGVFVCWTPQCAAAAVVITLFSWKSEMASEVEVAATE